MATEGGGLIIGGGSNAIVKNNLFARIQAVHSGGGLVIFDGGSPQIINNTIFSNQAPAFWGGGIKVDSSSTTIMNTIIAGHTTSEGISATNSQVFNSYNDFWNNQVDFQGAYPGPGNILTDPRFSNSQANDFHLLMGSPCIHAGTPDPAYNNPDGSRNDIGMYGGPGSANTNGIMPVYRFYNTIAGGHFFTIDEDEKNTVIQNYKWFRFEGVRFYAYPVQQPGTLPVYRFYNTIAGGHFFTIDVIDVAEKNTVIQNYLWFRPEGVGFYAYPFSN